MSGSSGEAVALKVLKKITINQDPVTERIDFDHDNYEVFWSNHILIMPVWLFLFTKNWK